MKNIIVKESPTLSKKYEKRYIVLDKDTGEILDDAQGYGYRTTKKAYSAWNYKHRDKSKDKERKTKERQIKAWMKKHESFVEDMTEYAFQICIKGSWGKDEKFDAKFVKRMLEDYKLETDFTAGELLKVWEKEEFK